ncbi:MAG TPA: NAD(P)-binding protein, partial [Blastocatellia bacterium]|nr:NAD(P)-binding protein [Blastocatellia bacterium]
MSMMDQTIWDWIIIGAGLGGLMSAALIKQSHPGASVLILESHTAVGGCAGCFERKIHLPAYPTKQTVRFDVGATTLSALDKGQSLERLLERLSIELPTHLADPGVQVIMDDGSVVRRYAEAKRWSEESTKHFGPSANQLWDYLDKIEQRSWKLLQHFPRFPPANIEDAISLLKPQAPVGLRIL